MNAMLTDDDLVRLCAAAADSFAVPAEGPGSVRGQLAGAAPTRPWLRRRGVQLAGAASVVAVAAVLAQGIGGAHVRTTAAPASAPAAADAGGKLLNGGAVMAPSAGGGAGAAGTEGSATPVQGPAASTQDAQRGPAAVSVPGAPVAGSKAIGADGAEARVVKTGTITLVVDHGKVGVTVKKVQGVIAGARGYVADQNSQEIGDNPTATVTMRVPVASFEGAVQQVRDLGAKVVSVSSTGKDVTAAYADTAAQIASLKAARSRFLTILAGANTIGETLTVQQRVDDVQGQIDRLEGQRRVLQSQSDLATLTVTVSEKVDAALKVAEPSGLALAWDRATHGFTSGVEGLIAHSGRALVVLVVVVLGLLVLRSGWRLARRRLV